MLLALWAGFPLTSWTGVVITPQANVILPDGGAKKGHRKTYTQVHEWPTGSMHEYLDAREAYLLGRNLKRTKKRSWQIPTPGVEPKPYQEIEDAPQANESQTVVARHPEKIPVISTQKMLAGHLAKIDNAQRALSRLQAQVEKTEQQMDDEAIELLLLS